VCARVNACALRRTAVVQRRTQHLGTASCLPLVQLTLAHARCSLVQFALAHAHRSALVPASDVAPRRAAAHAFVAHLQSKGYVPALADTSDAVPQPAAAKVGRHRGGSGGGSAGGHAFVRMHALVGARRAGAPRPGAPPTRTPHARAPHTRALPTRAASSVSPIVQVQVKPYLPSRVSRCLGPPTLRLLNLPFQKNGLQLTPARGPLRHMWLGVMGGVEEGRAGLKRPILSMGRSRPRSSHARLQPCKQCAHHGSRLSCFYQAWLRLMAVSHGRLMAALRRLALERGIWANWPKPPFPAPAQSAMALEKSWLSCPGLASAAVAALACWTCWSGLHAFP